jgi:hypothetical protein
VCYVRGIEVWSPGGHSFCGEEVGLVAAPKELAVSKSLCLAAAAAPLGSIVGRRGHALACAHAHQTKEGKLDSAARSFLPFQVQVIYNRWTQ